MSLHHLALGARDVDGLASFYRQVFGLNERARYFYDSGELRSIWLELNPGILMIEDTAHTREQIDGVGAGLFLMSFSVADPGSRTTIENMLEEKGFPIEDRTKFTSYSRDPEGNRIAFSLPLPS